MSLQTQQLDESTQTQEKDGEYDAEKILARHFSTIGIEDVFLSAPPHPLLRTYLKEGCSESFPSWELVGTIKDTPEDFCVREIFQTKRSIPGVADAEMQRLRVADLLSHENLPRQSLDETLVVEPNDSSSKPTESSNQSKKSETFKDRVSKDDGKNVETTKAEDLSPAEVIKAYLRKTFKSQSEAEDVLSSLHNLQKIATERIKPIAEGKLDQLKDQAPEPVWIPPASDHPAEDSASGSMMDASSRQERGGLHRALKAEFPLLKSEGAPKSDSETKSKIDHWIRVLVDEMYDRLVPHLLYPEEDIVSLIGFQKRGFDGFKSGSDSSKGAPSKKFSKNGPPKYSNGRASVNVDEGSQVVLRLRPGMSKDERRSVHHLIAEKCKLFATSTIPDYPLKPPKEEETGGEKKNDSTKKDRAPCTNTTVALVVNWQKHALQRGSKKRKRANDDASKVSDRPTHPHVLCVLKKRKKEHLTAMQLLSRAVRCRQSDIGIAGIKDMQAVTYQFCTIQNIKTGKMVNASQQLRRQGIELGNFYRVDWVLNNGDLHGNQFEVTVRNVRRIMVQSNGDQPAEEARALCDETHLGDMVGRIRTHGFINFFGEQRVGSAGRSEEVGVRGFDVGKAMLQQQFSQAINLLMTGRAAADSRESVKARQVRQAWKDTDGDPSATLKAFQNADIMPRERAVLKGLNRYGKQQPLEALRCLGYSMRIFWINSYQSYIWNQVASKRIQTCGNKIIKGDLYFELEDVDQKSIKVVSSDPDLSVKLSQVVLPLPGYNVRYPENDIGEMYRDLLQQDEVKFEKGAPLEATAKGSYRRLVVRPASIDFVMDAEDKVQLNFQLPKGCYATMLLRELMLTTATRRSV